MRDVGQVLEKSHAFAVPSGYPGANVRTLAVTLSEAVTAMRYVWIFHGTDATGPLLDTPTPIAPGEKIVFDCQQTPTELQFTLGLFVALSTSAASFSAGGVGATEAYFKGVVAPTRDILSASTD